LQSTKDTPGPVAEAPVAPALSSRATTESVKMPEIGQKANKVEKFSVADVQKKLLELGYKPGVTDGKMGPATIKALKKFQQDNDLLVTGQADYDTSAKLFQRK